MSDDPIMRGRRWKAFNEEEGGLRDMFATIRATYLDRLAQVDPWNVEQLQVLSLAHKVTQQVEGMVQAIVSGADVAQAAKDYAAKIQAIPAAKRRYM